MRLALVAHLRNGALFQWRLDQGGITQAEASRRAGVRPSTWSNAERMDFRRIGPGTIRQLSEATGLLPEEICPESIMRKNFNVGHRYVFAEIPEEELLACSPARLLLPAPTSEELDSPITAERLDAVLKTLTYREREVLRLRFGLGGEPAHTLEEVGPIFKINRERVRQIEARAIRKLRHPIRKAALLGDVDMSRAIGIREAE